MLKDPTHSEEMRLVAKSGSALIGKFITSSPGNSTQSRYARLLSFQKQKEVMYRGDPFTHIFLPVFRSMEADDRKTVAAIIATVQWASFFENILPASAKGIYLILENPCQGPFSYLIVGGEVQYLGAGDMHESQYNSMERISSFNYVEKVDDGTEFGIPLMNDYCPVTVKFYPSQVYVEETKSNRPLVSTAVVMIVFAFTAFMFLVYDRLVEYRQKLVLNRALQTSKIVESLFPKNVAARLLEQQEQNQKNNMTNNRRLKSFLSDENREKDSLLGQPIADLFPHTTVMFADVAGFTVRIVLIRDFGCNASLSNPPLFLSICFVVIIMLYILYMYRLGVLRESRVRCLFCFRLFTKPLMALPSAVKFSKLRLLGTRMLQLLVCRILNHNMR